MFIHTRRVTLARTRSHERARPRGSSSFTCFCELADWQCAPRMGGGTIFEPFDNTRLTSRFCKQSCTSFSKRGHDRHASKNTESRLMCGALSPQTPIAAQSPSTTDVHVRMDQSSKSALNPSCFASKVHASSAATVCNISCASKKSTADIGTRSPNGLAIGQRGSTDVGGGVGG